MSNPYPIHDFIALFEGAVVQHGAADFKIESLLTDSRKINSSRNAVFIAVKGERHDGHKFIAEAYKKGVRAFLVDEDLAASVPEAWVIKTNNCLHALQELTHKHRTKFDLPVIAITGSNGKTIVKEWLYQLLKDKYHVVKSPKSFNSQIGVPLSVWQIDETHDFGIFEAGISKPGEMGALEYIIQPKIGIFTNIGTAHDENFKNWDEKSAEKMRLFGRVEVLIYCRDFLPVHQQVTQNPKYQKLKTFTWSKKLPADLMVGKIEKQAGQTIIQAVFKNEFIQISIPFSDNASIENCISCWATLLYLGYDNRFVDAQFDQLTPVAMRLELKEGLNQCSVINDYYNSDLGSLEIALDFMLQQKQQVNKTLVLSDILQSGKSDEVLYEEVARLIASKGVSKFIGIGPQIGAQKLQFKGQTVFYPSTRAFLEAVDLNTFKNETILLKGARPFGFEKISEIFQKRAHQTVLEINLNAVTHNYNFLKSLLKPATKVMAMVKAFSYGSGAFEIANVLQFNLVDYLAVAYVDEGVELRKSGITTPIMVMNPEQQGYDLMIQYNLEPEVYSFKTLALFNQALIRNDYNHSQGYPVHIMLDTGMHRLGFEQKDMNKLSIQLKNYKCLNVASIFSHLAASDDPVFKQFTHEQVALFQKISTNLESVLGYTVIKHILNTAGALAYPDAQFDMVRLGVGLYGISAYPKYQKNLQPVSELKTTISQIKHIPAGESVGYSRAEMVHDDIVIATVPIGYADGLPRLIGKRKGYMLVNGKKAPIVGNVCMDMCMLDITHLAAEEGDEVTVFGKGLSVQTFAQFQNTIAYEALTNISPRVKRVYFQE